MTIEGRSLLKLNILCNGLFINLCWCLCDTCTCFRGNCVFWVTCVHLVGLFVWDPFFKNSWDWKNVFIFLIDWTKGSLSPSETGSEWPLFSPLSIDLKHTLVFPSSHAHIEEDSCGVSTGNGCSVVRLDSDVRTGHKLWADSHWPLAPSLTSSLFLQCAYREMAIAFTVWICSAQDMRRKLWRCLFVLLEFSV